MHAVLTCQKARLDLAEFGDDAAAEKDRLLEKFRAWAEAMCAFLAQQGYFADYIDPCSGLPMYTTSTWVYSEVDGMELLLKYRSLNAGLCKILLHPEWGSAMYPASLFTLAPLEVIQQALMVHSSLFFAKT